MVFLAMRLLFSEISDIVCFYVFAFSNLAIVTKYRKQQSYYENDNDNDDYAAELRLIVAKRQVNSDGVAG